MSTKGRVKIGSPKKRESGAKESVRSNRLLYSIRWQLLSIYLVIIVVVFFIIFFVLSSLVENYLVTQRLDDLTALTDSTAVQVAPYLSASDANSIYSIIRKNGTDTGGQIFVLNNSGVVEADSYSQLNGVKLSLREVDDILYGQNASSYGFHKTPLQDGSYWAAYCTSAVISNGRVIGAVLYATSIQDLIDAIGRLQRNTLWVFMFASVIVVISSIFSSGLITKPIKKLTDVAVKISNGDLSRRANIKGKSEIAEMAQTFDMMCGKLQNMDQQRNEFVSDASHELKTPLASMKILVESMLYQDHVPEEVYKEFLSDINGEIDRMDRLITDLLLISKMDSDAVMINAEKVSVSALIDKCVSSLLPIAKEKKISLHTQIPEDFEIECDPLKMRQALNNLIENAIKYSKSGGHVSVTARRYGSEAHIVVEDDGVGMSEEHLEHIFERFYRVDKARSRETGGTGLGLHIVRRIALMHGGRVNVVSEEGKGTTFTLVIPIVCQTEKSE